MAVAASRPGEAPPVELAPASPESEHVVDARPAGAAKSSAAAAPSEDRLRIFLLTRAEEAELVVPLIRDLHAESPFAHLRFSEKKARQRVLSYLKGNANQAGFYVLYKQEVVGIISLAVGPHYLSEEGLVATCLSFSVDPKLRKSMLGGRVAALMLRTGKQWARAQGATMLTIHGTSGYMGRMSKRATPMGVNVVMGLGSASLDA